MSSTNEKAAEVALGSTVDLLATERSISSSNETAYATQNNNQGELIDNTTLLKHGQLHVSHNFILIWLNSSMNEYDNQYNNSIIQFRHMTKSVQLFTDVDQCIEFMRNIKDDRILFILSQNIDMTTVSLINDLSQVDSIYIFWNEEIKFEQSLLEYKKVRGVFSDIMMIFNQLQRKFQQYEQDLISMNIFSLDSTLNLDELDQSFIYSLLLKEILLEMNYNEKATTHFFKLYHDQYLSDEVDLNRIDEIEKFYNQHSSIGLYIKMPSIYSLLNRILRTQDVISTIKMGSYLKDLHQHIKQVYSTVNKAEKLVVYRGQKISNHDFEKMKKTIGSLLLFNNFLSTTVNREVALEFINDARNDPHVVGILFEMEIEPSLSKIPFAPLKMVNDCSTCNDEILFSIHSFFHISEITKIDNGLWNVKMIMTNDINPQLERLTTCLREAIQDSNELNRLGNLLIKMEYFDQIEEIYDTLFQMLSSNYLKEFEYISNQIGNILIEKGQLEKALSFLEKTLEVRCKSLSSNHSDLVNTYTNIGLVYNKMENYSQALLFYEKALEIQRTILLPNYSDLIITYTNIASICNSMREYSKELSCYENILQIHLKYLSASSPKLIDTYNNIARVYCSMKDYLHAIPFYKKTLKIQQVVLPDNDLSIAITYNNIGQAHAGREYYSFARDSYHEALKIQEKVLDSNHPLLAETYNNVGEMYRLTGNCLDALQYFEKTLQIQEKIFDSNHPSLVTTKNNIDQVRNSMKDIGKLISYCETILKLKSKSFLSNDTSFHMNDDNIPTTLEGFHQYEETTLESSQTLNTITHNIESNHSQAAEYQEYVNQRTTIVSSENLHEKKVDKQWTYPVLLVLSSPETARLYSILKDITDSCLMPPIQTDECNEKLKSYQQIKELVLEVSSNISVIDRDRILSEISSFDNIQSIYLLGKPSETKKQRNEIFNQFDKVCIFCEDEEQIAVQWILDTASRCRMFGNQCIKTGDKAVASEHFQRGIELYERLKEFMKSKQRQIS